MILSFLKRTLIPQAALLACVFALRLLLPVRSIRLGDEDFRNALLQTGTFLLSAPAAWLAAMILTGYFLPGEKEKAPAAPAGRGWYRLPFDVWFFGCLALPFVLLALLLAAAYLSFILQWVWAVQFAAFLLYCIPLFNVFREKMGATVLENIERSRVRKAEREAKRAKGRKLKLRRDRLVSQIADAEREAERLRSSPLHDEDDEKSVVGDSIRKLLAKARELRQDLELIDQDTEGGG